MSYLVIHDKRVYSLLIKTDCKYSLSLNQCYKGTHSNSSTQQIHCESLTKAGLRMHSRKNTVAWGAAMERLCPSARCCLIKWPIQARHTLHRRDFSSSAKAIILERLSLFSLEAAHGGRGGHRFGSEDDARLAWDFVVAVQQRSAGAQQHILGCGE